MGRKIVWESLEEMRQEICKAFISIFFLMGGGTLFSWMWPHCPIRYRWKTGYGNSDQRCWSSSNKNNHWWEPPVSSRPLSWDLRLCRDSRILLAASKKMQVPDLRKTLFDVVSPCFTIWNFNLNWERMNELSATIMTGTISWSVIARLVVLSQSATFNFPN